MRTSSKFVGLAALLAAVTSVAARAAEEKSYANITRGKFALSESVSFNSIWQEGSSQLSTFNLTTQTQYFLADRLALGLLFNLQNRPSSTNIVIGPVMTYFFWERDRLGAFYSQSVGVQTFATGSTTAATALLTSQLGLDYFVTPAVAFGPLMQFFHEFGTASFFARVNEFSFLGQFAIFL